MEGGARTPVCEVRQGAFEEFPDGVVSAALYVDSDGKGVAVFRRATVPMPIEVRDQSEELSESLVLRLIQRAMGTNPTPEGWAARMAAELVRRARKRLPARGG